MHIDKIKLKNRAALLFSEVEKLHVIIEDQNIMESLIALIPRWFEPHRYYHNEKHLLFCLEESKKLPNLYDQVFCMLVSWYHDAVYNPTRNDNEEMSAACVPSIYLKIGGGIITDEMIKECIINTKLHRSENELYNLFNNIDMAILKTDSLYDLIEYENSIFKEYQHVKLNDYIKTRIEFINLLEDKWITDNNKKILIDYITNRKYKIGIYAGSFDPFHIGHYDILKQAEKYFDKVVIGLGTNIKKSYSENRYETLKSVLPYNEILRYSGILSEACADYSINANNVEVTLIRGLRNISDLQSEQNLRSVLMDCDNKLNTVYFLCDSKHQHISSSAIRELQSFRNDYSKYTFSMEKLINENDYIIMDFWYR